MIKKIFLLLLYFTLVQHINAQKPWRAKLFVHFIDDNTQQIKTDTVWFGLDTAGNDGIQTGLDIFDTVGANFKILSHDSIVQQQFNTDCGNLKYNIKKTKYGLSRFDFYALGHIISMSWDTSDFLHNDSINQYYNDRVYFNSYNGYIGGWDITTLYLLSRFANKNYIHSDSIKVMPESPLFYCNRNQQVFRFSLTINFRTKLLNESVNELKNKSFLITPNPCKDFLYITLNDLVAPSLLTIQLYSLTGKLLKEVPFEESINTIKIDLSDMQEGLYILKINDPVNSYSLYSKIIKTNY
jgi:hypothetical protein